MHMHSIALRALILSLFLSLTVLAQTATTGTIVGSVTDKNGAVLSGAEVELTDTATNISVKMMTNEEGQYVFPSVTPGVYTLAVSKAGFRKANVNNFKVDVAKSYTLPISLEIGDVQQVVEVTAAFLIHRLPFSRLRTPTAASSIPTGTTSRRAWPWRGIR